MTKEELEKKSEEYANEYGQDAFTQFNMPQMIEPVRIERKLGFQKGAEFGYNKANEWHYVKDGDLPKKEGMYLVSLFIFDNEDFDNPSGYVYRVVDVLIDEDKNIFLEEDMFDSKWEQVIAWKEIVLPELPKENE